MTDFGEEDGYVGIMKGVIQGIAPGAVMIDLSHGIPPQDVLAGALTLHRAVEYFPPESVFVCVVDPGVGTRRRSIAARLGRQYYVGPDNGLLTLWLEQAEKQRLPVAMVELDRPHMWRDAISNSFHGRDIYAPCAAHLARGTALADLGSPIQDPICLDIPQPAPTNRGWSGMILHVDHFGNLATNIERKHLVAFAADINLGIPDVLVRYGEYTINGISATFGEARPGTLTAIIDSAGRLSLALVNGNARDYLGAEIGDMVHVLRELDESDV
jgi:S-adenosylmethionine hydrolase